MTTVIGITAPWCEPCKSYMPLAKEVCATLKLPFSTRDATVDVIFANKYSVKSVPTLLIFKDGELINRVSGTKSADELKKSLTEHI